MRETNLRPLSAQDQIEFLDRDPGTTPSARLVTAVLAKCSGMAEEDAARLTVGEREALLLQLRSLTFGDRMSCVMRCPRAECGERMDLDLRVSELIVESHPEAPGIHEAVVDDWRVKFRVPDGADQEAVSRMAYCDEQRAVETLLRRCVQSVERDGQRWSEIPAALAERISETMAELDPQAEIALDATCPACGKGFRTILDTATFFFAEIASHARVLLGEVHVLASVYHWSEAAILAMAEGRRRHYLDLVEASFTRRASA
jgi:hypothetical protein